MQSSTNKEDPVEVSASLLRPFMPDVFKVDYLPEFPRPYGGTGRWFQVVFAIGPGIDAAVGAEVHSLFERILLVLSDLTVVRNADAVSLRARRRIPESPLYRPDHPLIYIESSWTGAAITAMYERREFSSWASMCSDYINRFDRNDPLARRYEPDSIT